MAAVALNFHLKRKLLWPARAHGRTLTQGNMASCKAYKLKLKVEKISFSVNAFLNRFHNLWGVCISFFNLYHYFLTAVLASLTRSRRTAD